MIGFSSFIRVAIATIFLYSCFFHFGSAAASPEHRDIGKISPVFLPVVSQFRRSPIPVFYPTWLPPIRYKAYAGFQTYKRQSGVGPGYALGLYTSARYQDHVHRLFEIYGIAGDTYTVSTLTRPIWLGKGGWAYADPDGNAGWTISFVRDAGHATYPAEYTYTVLGGCTDGLLQRLLACLRHIAASVQRYARP